MLDKEKMSAAELGALWMTFQSKTMIIRVLDYFIEKSVDQEARDLMSDLRDKLQQMVTEIIQMFAEEGAVIPNGFTKEDVHLDAPQLYENGFDIMLCRVLKEISMGSYVLHMTTAYRRDIIQLYRKLTNITQEYYDYFTTYLIENDYLSRPNYTLMPKTVDYIHNKSYMKGTNIFGHKRDINTVEFGILYHTIETNITGMQLMKGFSQCSKDEEVRKYFTIGQELSKEIVRSTEDLLLESNIKPPATPGGTVTNSTEAPFSEKMMIHCAFLLGGFSLGAQGFSESFILRNDVLTKTAVLGKDTYEFLLKGAKLMMSKGWLEEPPKMY
ncbi:uncharacterized protein DUF3231 [Cytobacillus horneckiae]|uniref:DUF3231 domain-containing protein n=1 Tax=Cytobacillus horneckiae TaxID=549687 RepID=A0A2N0ZK49_9BACI|nr:DUF3231 family protein [Cytobacillus horneckiae]MBN6888206.1 DUF3231 family protein [Cytobacillus horneckiae]MCM3177062.1 DUF3231 family protein [Cytobacillus horneckiae]MEC1154761.1 DUF3231 family protein [Cytobacillus horneckiae]MED2940254.1 DUF3231 family protein [Cytobacillus horneckiae]PKG29895.1 DUF3231 domain-containing protein [Cytobacillus horneckiae]